MFAPHAFFAIPLYLLFGLFGAYDREMVGINLLAEIQMSEQVRTNGCIEAIGLGIWPRTAGT